MAENPPRELVRKLQDRTKTLRLSFEEADLALELILAGAKAVARERARATRDERIEAGALGRSRSGGGATQAPKRRRAFYA